METFAADIIFIATESNEDYFDQAQKMWLSWAAYLYQGVILLLMDLQQCLDVSIGQFHAGFLR